MSAEQLKKILTELKDCLTRVYKNHFKGIYLFGSYARGTQEAESDIDVLIVLDHYSDYAAEIDRIGKILSDLSLQNEVSINTVFVRESDWSHGQNPFLRNVRKDAIAA